MDLNFDVAGNTADFVKNAEQISSVIGAITSEVERQGQSVGLSMSLLSSSISDTAGKSDILSGALKKMFNACRSGYPYPLHFSIRISRSATFSFS